MSQQTFHGFPIAEAARAVGFSYVTVWRHAHGKAPVSPKAALLYEARLGIPRQVLNPELWPPQTETKRGDPTNARNADENDNDPDRSPF